MTTTTKRFPEADAHLAEADPVMARLVEAHGPCRLDLRPDPFEALGRSILYQQLAGAAARTITGRVMALFDGAFPTPAQLLKVDEDALADCGVSAQKRGYLLGLARAVEAGDLDLGGLDRRSDEEVVEALTEVKGIGRWTAEMFLMFSLGRPDVLPVGDLGLRKGVGVLYGLGGEDEDEAGDGHPSAAEVEAVAEPWRPWRTVGTWYVWRALDGEAAIGPD